MKKVILFIISIFFQLYSPAQRQPIDSLKTELAKATTDTARLRIYLELGVICEAKDNLLYAEPAWKLVDKLFSTDQTEAGRQQLLSQEQLLPYLVVAYYTDGKTNVTDWNKVSAYTDARLKAIENTRDQKRAGSFLFTMAGIALDEKKDSALFRSNIQKSLSFFKAIKDSVNIVEGYRFMCSFYKSAGNFSEAFDAVQSSIAFSRQLNYSKGISSGLTQLADLYRDYGEQEQALAKYQEALDVLYKTKDTAALCNVLASTGGFYRTLKNPVKALEYYKKVIALTTHYNKTDFNTGNVYMWMGLVYTDTNDYTQAQLNFEKGLQLFKEAGDGYRYLLVMNELGLMYKKMGDFEKALDYHTRMIRMMDSLPGYQKVRPSFLHYLAADYYLLKNYAKAKALNDEALTGFKRSWFDIRKISEMELLATQIDSARGDGMGAYTHYKEYTGLMDRIKGEEVRKEGQKEKYQLAFQKQQAEQDKKEAVARRTRNLQYIAIGAVLLLGILLLYGYMRTNRDKHKIEKAYTELKNTQSQLVHAEKMASLGELTAGIAHEIQNPLNFVNNFSELNSELIKELRNEAMKGDMEEVNALANDIESNSEKINHHGKRAADIVKGMLQHSRTSSGQKELTDINALCDEYLRLSYHGLRAKDKTFNAAFETDFDTTLPKINVTPQDLGRVILNLINNAFYAVTEKKKKETEGYHPTVKVSTQQKGTSILIQVKDNGTGIPQQVMDKIFQPFFTTKPTGQGTGLGLSLSYDIIKTHGGELNVESQAGEGSTFIITLPC